MKIISGVFVFLHFLTGNSGSLFRVAVDCCVELLINAYKKPTPAFQTKQTQTTKKECINYDGYIMMNVFRYFLCKYSTNFRFTKILSQTK